MIHLKESPDYDLFGISTVHDPGMDVWKRYLDWLMGFVDKRSFLPVAAEAYEYIERLIRNKEGENARTDFSRIMSYMLEEADSNEVSVLLDHLFLKTDTLYYLNTVPEFEEETYYRQSVDNPDEYIQETRQSYRRIFFDSVRELEIEGKKMLVCYRYKESLVDVVFEGGRLLSAGDFEKEIQASHESGYWERIQLNRDGLIKLYFLGRWPSWVTFGVDAGSSKELKVVESGSDDYFGLPIFREKEEEKETGTPFYDIDEMDLPPKKT